MFLHVVEQRPDGIVVRGAKAHQTGFINSHEVIVMPTMSMGEEDKEYAVSYAIEIMINKLALCLKNSSTDIILPEIIPLKNHCYE